jgi:hypothetical protein
LNKNVDWKNYVVEADIENVQTSTGILGRSNINLADSSTADSFAGVLGFISNDATKGAIGRSDPQNYTGWAGNYTDSVIDTGTAPGSSVHLKMTFNNNMITLEIFDLETEERIYHFVTYASDWTQGTVGFRVRFMYNATQKSSFNTVAFDNLKVTELVESETGGQIAGGSCGNNVTWKLYDDGSLVISGSGEDFCYPCGACRQFLYEFNPDMEVISLNAAGESKCALLRDLLPCGFGPSHLEKEK